MDRITVNTIKAIIENLNRITGLTYRYEQNGSWHTLYCEGSRLCAANTKRKFYDNLYAIQSQLYTLDRMKKLS